MANLILRPNKIGFYNAGWDVSPSAARWENIDDADHDGDTTYVYADVADEAFTVGLTGTSLPGFPRPARIPAVTVVSTVRGVSVTPTTFRFRVRYLGVDYDSEDLTIATSSYVDRHKTYVTLPSGHAWNSLKMNDMELGLVYVSGVELRCTKLELQIHTEIFPEWTLGANGDGFHTDWTAVPGVADKFRHLTAPFDGDLSHLSSVTAGDQYTATLGDLGILTPATIDRVRASALVRNDDDTTPSTVKVLVRSGGSDFDGATTTDGHVLPVEGARPIWVPISATFLNEPSSGWPSGNPAGSAWVKADVDALEIGVEADTTGPEARVTSVELEAWLKNTPVSTLDALPQANGVYTDLPPIVPNGGEAAWQDVDEAVPDDAATYIGADADTAGGVLYATFDTNADTFVLSAGERIHNVEVRLRLRLGSTSDAVLAPLIRWDGETHMGLPVRLEGTGATWIDVKEDFFTNPVTGLPWKPTVALPGTFSVTNGVATLTSSVDHDASGALEAGDSIEFNGSTTIFAVASISGTSITLDANYDGSTDPVATAITGTVDAEYGMAILQGEVFLSRVRAQIQTSPDVSGTTGASDFQLTDDADTFIARAAIPDGTVYAPLEFAVGTGGFDVADPKTITAINKADTGLISEIARFPISKVTWDFTGTPKKVWYWCRVPRDTAVDAIGEVGLFAQIFDSPFPAEIGTTFMFGIMHMPCQCRHEDDVHLYILRVDYP